MATQIKTRKLSRRVTSEQLERLEADRRLVDRCLSGDSMAWSEIYDECHDRLLAAIRRILRSSQPDASLVDEIAARVWYAAVKDDGELLRRFDPAKNCRLITFLAAIARFEARTYLRSERRLRDRENAVSMVSPRESKSQSIDASDLQHRFLDALTPRERQFLEQELLGSDAPPASKPFSDANSWQLRHRVESKLEAFFRD